MLTSATLPQLSELRAEQERRRCKSFHGFIQSFWPVIEPVTPFKDNWHLRVISEHLEACAKRQIRRLLINVPPRTMKSISVAVMFPPWVWGPFAAPHERFVYTSYSSPLSCTGSRHCRKIIASEKYQDMYGDVFNIRKGMDKDTEVLFENDSAGFRYATSVGGVLTGEGGSFLVWDDPHSALEAQSDTIRNGVVEWYKQTFSTRLNDPANDVEIGVMQRLHEGDLAGHVLSEVGGFEHLCIPMEWDGVKRKTFLGSYDPRTKKDELLWAERFPVAEVKLLAKKLGQYGASGQLQQSPAPTEGGIIKTNRIKLWPSEAKLPVFEFVLQSYDGAFTKETQNDPSGMLAFGIFSHKGVMKAMLLDAWEEHLEYPELRKKAAEEYKSFYGEEDGGQHGVDCVLIEDKGSGISLRQDLNRSGLPARPYNPGRADKVMRAHRIAPLIEAGLFYVMESPSKPGKPVSWADWCFKDWKLFPNAKHDEAVDCLTQALIYFQDAGFISIDVLEEDDGKEAWERNPKKRNPYSTTVR